MKKVKAVKIDAENGKVSDVIIEKSVDSFQKEIGCERFDMVSYDTYNDIVLDDNGLNTNKPLLMLFGKMNLIRGNVLIVGVDNSTGGTIDTTLNANYVRNQVMFIG